MARTAAPIPMNSRRCRACRADRARISATLALAMSRLLLDLDTCSVPLRRTSGRPAAGSPGSIAIRAYWTP
jgi:hypothetical protein